MARECFSCCLRCFLEIFKWLTYTFVYSPSARPGSEHVTFERTCKQPELFAYNPRYPSQEIRCESCFYEVMKFRYRDCYVSVIMRPSGYFISPLLVLGAIWVWDHCCEPWVSAIPAACLLCSTAIRRDIRAIACFCSCKLAFHSVECVLLLCFNAQLWIWCHIVTSQTTYIQ